jgi:hypothetical protein
MILTQTANADNPGIVVPVLAYTLVPVVSFREPGGELTSALVSILLSHGFQLALRPDHTDILDQAAEVKGICRLGVTRAGIVTLDLGGETSIPSSLTRSSQTMPTGWKKLATATSWSSAATTWSSPKAPWTLTRLQRWATWSFGKVPVRS